MTYTVNPTDDGLFAENAKKLIELNANKAEIEAQIDDIKKDIEEELEVSGYDGLKAEGLTVSYTAESETIGLDTGAIKKDKELYDQLIKHYPKVTKKAGHYNYRFKESKEK